MSVIFNRNIIIGGRTIVGSGGTPPLTGIVLTFSEFNQSGLVGGQNIEDPSGTFNIPYGFTIDGDNGSGVAMTNLTSENIAAFQANPNNNGFIWNVTWGRAVHILQHQLPCITDYSVTVLYFGF